MSLLRLKPPIFPPQFPTPASSREAPRFKRYDDKINHRNVKGETQLHRAAAKGDCELMQTLLDHGAYADISDFAGWTPLHEAVAESCRRHFNLAGLFVLPSFTREETGAHSFNKVAALLLLPQARCEC